MLRFKKLLLITTIIFFVGFIPLEFAHGDILEDIAETMGNAIVHAMALAVGAIAGILQTVAANILSFALSDQFISHSGANSSLVQDGWGIVRNFANAALVIGLVIIAINIILGKEEGKAKESLIVFIIAALLINFTPLICGFIIDAVNLLGRSFIGEGVGGDIFQKMNTYMEAAKEVENPIQAFANVIFVFYFSVLTFVIYLLYALLFVVRAIFLWILIIASPIAVATRVFPKSNIIRKFFPNILYWDDWIETFLQWTLMIVPAGLFIYLSNFAMKSVVGGTIVAADGNILQQLVTALFSYIIPIVILYIGFLLTIIAGGSIASPIGNMGKKAFGAIKGATINTAKKAGTWTKEGATGMIGSLPTSFNNSKASGAGNLKSAGSAIRKSFNFQSREVGRGNIDSLKNKVVGFGKRTKDVTHFGKDQDYQSRSLKAEEVLTKTPEEYFKGGSESEVQAEVQIAKQRISSAESRGDTETAKKLKKGLVSAAVNNDKLGDQDIEKLFKDFNMKMDEFVNKMSPADALKNLNATALKRNEILKNLSDHQSKNILLKGSTNQKSNVFDFIINDQSGKSNSIRSMITQNITKEDRKYIEDLDKRSTGILSENEKNKRKKIYEDASNRI